MRRSGILLPVSSLPSPYGIGNLGREAHRFLGFLSRAGQSCWQVLPLGPTGPGNSPYQSFSAFAANLYFIDPDALVRRGLLRAEEPEKFAFGEDPGRVNYAALLRNRFRMLHLAAGRFEEDGGFRQFREAQRGWLEDYALFMAVKEENGGKPLSAWPEEIRLRSPSALRAAQGRLAEETRFWEIAQYLFWEQWAALRKEANANGISIIGDLPIYVSPDSADLWAHSELFQVDGERRPTEVAGCPPDDFCRDGQLWHNPLYNWERHAADGYRWWRERLSTAAEMFDAVRIDHFRGLAGYYAVPAGDRDARNGCWRKGPGEDFIRMLKEKMPGLPIIAEDLGFLTDDVRELLAKSGYPGMKVLQFAFNPQEESDYLPHRHIRNCVVYTGTHDNTTLEGWVRTAPKEQTEFARRYLGVGPRGDLAGAMIRAAQASVAETCIIPMQDYLHLGAKARINTPGTVGGGNWQWRLRPGELTPELADEIRAMTVLYNREARPT